MQHETTHGNRSLKIRLNWAIFYVILILETRLIKDRIYGSVSLRYEFVCRNRQPNFVASNIFGVDF